MKFREGTTVKTIDGDKVGTVDQIVVDPTNNEVTHIIVEKGFLFTEDRVVPVSKLRDADDDSIVLEGAVEELEQFPEYKHTYFVADEREFDAAEEMPPQWGDWMGGPLYYYPPVGTHPHTYYPGVGFPINTGQETVKREARNIPSDTVVIDEGTKVTTADGAHAGDVEQTFTDDEGRLTHILISKGFLFTQERLIPINWVRQMNETEIRLNVPSEVVENVPEFATS